MWFKSETQKKTNPSLFLSPVTSTESEAKEEVGNLDSTLSGRKEPQGEEAENEAEVVKRSGFSPLLSLPVEILYQIIELVYYNDDMTSISANLERFANTFPPLLKKINEVSLRFLYKYAIFNRPQSFDAFWHTLVKNPELGRFVEFMDFQIFTSIGLGRTGRMNQEIQMLTAETILKSLCMTPNLIEFLGSENIQDDLDQNVLFYLFNNLKRIQALDFCGASSLNFSQAFRKLEILPNQKEETIGGEENVEIIGLSNLFKISFHDCLTLSPDVFVKLLPHFTSLRRLDLTHTSITSTTLNSCLPHSARLSHLSLARCSRLTTKELINFLTLHPAVSNNLLTWLSLQCDVNTESVFKETYLYYTLNNLKANGLLYLNLGGAPVNARIMKLIKERFPHLESLSIAHSLLEVSDINEYLENNYSIKFLDIYGCRQIPKSSVLAILRYNYGSSLCAVETDYNIAYEATNGTYVEVRPFPTSSVNLLNSESYEPELWKFYDNEGRRSWIYKITADHPDYQDTLKASFDYNTNLTYYDMETGEKIVRKEKKPDFLKYASRKINCSIGYFNLNVAKKKKYLQNEICEEVWPPEFSQKGIYNYYSLNIK